MICETQVKKAFLIFWFIGKKLINSICNGLCLHDCNLRIHHNIRHLTCRDLISGNESG